MAAWNLDAIAAREEGFRDTREANLCSFNIPFSFFASKHSLLVCAREQEVGTCRKSGDV